MQEVAPWIALFGILTSGIGVPVLIFMSGRNERMLQSQNVMREEKFREIHKRLDHFDDCIDDVKKIVLGESVTRSDFATFRAELTEALTRIRNAMSLEQSSQDERIMRLENMQFKRDG